MTTTREHIVDCAAELMWRQGYSRTSVDEIIDAADICKGSFYHHFSSKDALGLAVIDCWAHDFATEINARLSDGASAVENLDAILDTTVETQAENGYKGCPLGRLALEMGDASEAFRARLDDAFAGWREIVGKYLQQAGMRRVAAADYATYMLATLEGGLMMTKIGGKPVTLTALVEQMKTNFRGKLREVAA